MPLQRATAYEEISLSSQVIGLELLRIAEALDGDPKELFRDILIRLGRTKVGRPRQC